MLGLGKADLEGTLPDCLGGFAKLQHLSVSGGEAHRPKLRGCVPSNIANLESLGNVLGSSQQLEGGIPRFTATLSILALHNNNMQKLTLLRSKASMIALLHNNHLSCRLPTHSASHVKLSLVAVGNHLTWTDEQDLPAWILPMERDGLFWQKDGTAVLLLLKVLAGCGSMVFAFMLQVRVRKLTVAPWWGAACGDQGALIRSTASLFSFMASQLVGSCLLLLVVLSCDYYICPGRLTLASACLLRRPSVHCFVMSRGVASALWLSIGGGLIVSQKTHKPRRGWDSSLWSKIGSCGRIGCSSHMFVLVLSLQTCL